MAHDVLRYPLPANALIDGRFRVKRGGDRKGGMSGLFLVEDEQVCRRSCMLKMLAPAMHPFWLPGQHDLRRFFRNEVETLVALGEQSRSFTRIFGTGTLYVLAVVPGSNKEVELDLPYYAMELLRGCDLKTLISRRGPKVLPMAIVLQLCEQAAQALSIAHRMGIIHRDLKPDNLYLHVDPDGTAVLFLIDFGVSTRHGAPGVFPSGTKVYGAPELIRGATQFENKQSDIYPFGLIMYEIASNVHAMEEHADDYVHAHLYVTPPSLSSRRQDVPKWFERLTHACLAKKPGDRPTADEIYQELKTERAKQDDAENAGTALTELVSTTRRQRKETHRRPPTQPASVTSPPEAAEAPLVIASESFFAAPRATSSAVTLSGAAAAVAPLMPTMKSAVLEPEQADNIPSESFFNPPPPPDGTNRTATKPGGVAAIVAGKPIIILEPAILEAPSREASRAAPAADPPVRAPFVNDTDPDGAPLFVDETTIPTDLTPPPALDEPRPPVFTSMARAFDEMDDETSYVPSPFDAEQEEVIRRASQPDIDAPNADAAEDALEDVVYAARAAQAPARTDNPPQELAPRRAARSNADGSLGAFLASTTEEGPLTRERRKSERRRTVQRVAWTVVVASALPLGILAVYRLVTAPAPPASLHAPAPELVASAPAPSALPAPVATTPDAVPTPGFAASVVAPAALPAPPIPLPLPRPAAPSPRSARPSPPAPVATSPAPLAKHGTRGDEGVDAGAQATTRNASSSPSPRSSSVAPPPDYDELRQIIRH